MSIAQASRHFGIPSQSGIVVWLNKYGFDRDIISYKEDSISFDPMKEFAKSKHSSDEAIKKRLIELEVELTEGDFYNAIGSVIRFIGNDE